MTPEPDGRNQNGFPKKLFKKTIIIFKLIHLYFDIYIFFKTDLLKTAVSQEADGRNHNSSLHGLPSPT